MIRSSSSLLDNGRTRRTGRFTHGSAALRMLLLGGIVSFGTEIELQAYVDPGAGAMIWQVLVAGFLGALFYFRKLLPGFWLKKKDKADSKPAAPSAETEKNETLP